MIVLLKIGAVLLGLFSLWIALFCFEDEEGKIQNILEEWWVRLDQSKKTALFTEFLFVKGVAKTASRSFDRLFGPRIISVRAIGVSLSLSLFSLVTGWAIYESDWDEHPGNSLFVLSVGLLCLLLSIFPASHKYSRWGKVWCAFVAVLAMFLWGNVIFTEDSFDNFSSFGPLQWTRLFCFTLFLTLTSLGCDVGFILVTRRVLQIVSATNKLFTMIAVLFFTYLLGFFLVALPWYALIFRPTHHTTSYEFGSNWFFFTWDDIVTMLTYSNLLDGIVVSVLVAIAAIMLIHRLIWPVLERFVYGMSRLGIARRRKLLTTLAVMLLSFGLGKPLDWLSKLLDAVK